MTVEKWITRYLAATVVSEPMIEAIMENIKGDNMRFPNMGDVWSKDKRNYSESFIAVLEKRVDAACLEWLLANEPKSYITRAFKEKADNKKAVEMLLVLRKKQMTITEYVRSYLMGLFCYESIVDPIMEEIKGDEYCLSFMRNRWEDGIHGYDQAVKIGLIYLADRASLEWLKANMPRHFIIPYFEEKVGGQKVSEKLDSLKEVKRES